WWCAGVGGAHNTPAIVEGQIRGGVAQGIGAVLLERSAYDEAGNWQSATLMDYLVPTACDIPRIEIEHLETVALDADVNFRGVGEGGMIVAPPTVVNAIEDALSPFGVRIYEQHLPPARILELVAAKSADWASRAPAGRPRPSRARARPRHQPASSQVAGNAAAPAVGPSALLRGSPIAGSPGHRPPPCGRQSGRYCPCRWCADRTWPALLTE